MKRSKLTKLLFGLAVLSPLVLLVPFWRIQNYELAIDRVRHHGGSIGFDRAQRNAIRDWLHGSGGLEFVYPVKTIIFHRDEDDGEAKLTAGALQTLENFPKLRALDLGNRDFTPSLLRHVGNAERITHLIIGSWSDPQRFPGGTEEDWQALARFHSLEHLALRNLRVQGNDLEALSTMRHLTSVWITSSEISSDAWDDLLMTNQLEKLLLRHTKMDTSQLPKITKLRKLKKLFLVGINYSTANDEIMKTKAPHLLVKFVPVQPPERRVDPR